MALRTTRYPPTGQIIGSDGWSGQARLNIVLQEAIRSGDIPLLFQELPFRLDQCDELILQRFGFLFCLLVAIVSGFTCWG